MHYAPDLVIMAYLLNDTFQVSYSKRLYRKLPASVSRGGMIALNASYLLRFLRVRFHYLVTDDEVELLGAPDVLRRNPQFISSLDDMQRMADMCAEKGIAFAVVVLPYMNDFDLFDPYYTMVEDAVAERGMPVDSFAADFDDFHGNTRSLQISDTDAHPSAAANQIMGAELYSLIQRLKNEQSMHVPQTPAP